MIATRPHVAGVASIAVALGLLVAACGGGGGSSGSRSAVGGVCRAVGIAHREILEPEGLDVAGMVDDGPWSATEVDAAAAIRFIDAGSEAGRFEPLLDHLASRHRARSEPGEAVAPASASVRRLAADLDDLLGSGGCG